MKNEKYTDAYQMYLDGLSLSQVAAKLGVTRQCVFKAFKCRGFILRSPNFQPHQFFNNAKFTLRNHGYYEKSTGDRCLMHRYVWEFYNGTIPKGYDIHHIDRDKANNNIKNLEMLEHSHHAKIYSTGNNQYTNK